MKQSSNRGFTILEVLVVVAIITILASVVLFSVSVAKNRARISRTNTELALIAKSAMMAQGASGTLLSVTGSGCSDCSCRSIDIRNIATSHACYLAWINAISRIATSAGSEYSNVSNITRDPWGSPYCLDENEREGGPSSCGADTLRSVGPDGMWGTADDISTALPLSGQCP